MTTLVQRPIAWLARQWLLHAPTERGKTFVMREIFPRLAPEAADFTTPAPGGGLVRARLTESTGWDLLHGADVEGEELRWAVGRVRPGDTVVDAGANIGLFTVPLARAVGSTGCVIAIEPNAAAVERLRASIALNRLTNVQVETAAVGDTSGQAEFFVAADSAYSGLQPDERSPATATTTVQMVTVDAVWASAGRPRVTLLKLDVEGAEARALAGAEELLAACRPAVLLEARDEVALAPLSDWLGPRGYREEARPSFRPYNRLFESSSAEATDGPSASP